MSHLQDQLAAMAATSTESIVELFSSLDDRPTAIVATSFLEDFLRIAIAYKFARFPSESEFGNLFAGYGPLATLSAKIMIAYNLNVISAETRHDFGIIKDIRNTFSHTYLPISFKTDKISTKCNNLKLTTDIKPPLSKHIKDDSRGRYIKSVVTIMSFLVSNMILSKHEKALLGFGPINR
jgi:DNA-binding MltR family transcriptional regulator